MVRSTAGAEFLPEFHQELDPVGHAERLHAGIADPSRIESRVQERVMVHCLVVEVRQERFHEGEWTGVGGPAGDREDPAAPAIIRFRDNDVHG